MLTVIPAIDLRGGNCVRLVQGKLENEEIYSKDPVFIAKLWQSKGATRLHIADLDGAFSGIGQNFAIIKEIRKSLNIMIQVGGGIRNMASIEKALDIGIDRVILGTVVVYNPKILEEAVTKFGEKVVVAVDVSDDKIAIGGWKEISSVGAEELVKKIEAIGVKEIVYTDIKKDGTLEGPNYSAIENVCRSTKMGVIAAGGIGQLGDISRLKELSVSVGLKGVVVGKALYNENVNLEEAFKMVQE